MKKRLKYPAMYLVMFVISFSAFGAAFFGVALLFYGAPYLFSTVLPLVAGVGAAYGAMSIVEKIFKRIMRSNGR